MRWLFGVSVLALCDRAAVAAEPVVLPVAAASAEQASGQSVPTPTFARSQRINPTGRDIALTVPARDGAVYLGDLPMTLKADDTIELPTERTLQLLGGILAPDVLQSLRTSLAGKAFISPDELVPAGVTAVYDPQRLEMKFTIPSERRAARSLSVTPLDRERFGDMLAPQDFSAYLNIRGSLDLVEDGTDTGFGDPVFLLDGAVRLGPVVAESDAIWSPGSNGGDFQRLGSRLVYDDMSNLIRWTAGDLETQSRGFQAAPDIAGISLFRSYSVLNPQQIIRPRGDRNFRLDRPSTVEVYVNGQQVRRLQLAPGNYDLRDFPFAQGANDIRLNVLDDTGRSEVLRFNIFLEQTQLAKGLSEFGLYAGVKAPLGLNGPDYSDEWIVSGFYRRGISDYVTLGVNVQADKDVQMGGIEAVFGTSIGTFGMHAAASHMDGVGEGYALQATFQRLISHGSGRSDTLNLFFEHRSKNFAPVSFFLPDNPYSFELGGGYSHAFSDTVYAGVDARYSKGRGIRPDTENYRLTAGWRISSAATLTAEGRYTNDSRGKEWSGFLSLTVRLGRFSSVRTEYDSRDNRMRASFQTLHGSGVGSYNITGDIERSDNGAGINLNANYFTNRAELGLSHYGVYTNGFGDSLNQRTSFRLGTSLALAGGEVSIGRPIYDSFAIVKPHRSLEETNILVEPTPYGYSANTGALGTGTMPSLSSYSERTIPIEVENAAPGTDVGQGSFRVFPAYRSGYVLEVGSDYNVTALGTMLDVDGEPVSLVTGRAIELAHPDRPAVTMFTNRMGRFGATGLAAGQWRIEMLDAKKSVYLVTIPEDARGIVRLGEVRPVKGN